jgi:hypothetical protein
MGYITIIATNLNNMAAAIPTVGKLLAGIVFFFFSSVARLP